MPDQTRQTISATQAPALWNVSPYVTRWMLYRHFADGLAIDDIENSRMSWGKKMQPLLLQQAAEDLRLEVIPNAGDDYHRRGLLGCTRDATIICPDRGPGALETKCVFDFRVWMETWKGGRQPPRQHEIQVQQQMLVGDDEPYRWGVIAVWVCGEMKYFEREPLPDLWAMLNTEAAAFFDDVKAKREPDPFGVPIEVPLLTLLFPPVAGNVLDLSQHPDAGKIAATAALYANAKEQESAGASNAEEARAKLLAIAKDAEEIVLRDGMSVTIRKHGKGKRVRVFIPDTAAPVASTIPSDILMAG